MSDYKFKVGDRVRILKMDEWCCRGMEENIDKIAVVVNCYNDEGAVGYNVNLSNGKFAYFYMEDSLELVNEKLISKDDVLSILYETKESGIFNYGTIYDLIRRVSDLPCK